MHRLIALFADAADAVVVADRQGRVVHANEAAEQLFGLLPGEAPEMPLTSLCPFGVELEGGPPDGRLVRCHTRDGKAFDSRVVVLNIATEEIPLSVCVFWPLGGIEDERHASTGYQRALLQLARTKELSGGDFEAAARAICVLAAETMQVERISVWLLDDAAEVLSCACLYERTKRTFSSGTKLTARDYPRYFAALEEGRAIAAHDAVHDPRTSEFAHGYLDVRGIGAMLDSVLRVEGKVVGAICHEHVGPPRTWREQEIVFAGELADQAAHALLSARRAAAEEEREQMEAELRQAQKLEALGRLSAGVAHDFNNLLSVILGNAELARSATTREELEVTLDEIRTAGERAADLTSRLLAIGRRQVLTTETVDWNERLHESIQLLRRLIPADILLEFQPTDDCTLVEADPTQLDQILMNLCLNARDAIQGGGRITVTTRRERSENGHGADVVLRVEDDGAGIPEEFRDRIFDPFFTSKELGSGTGLGLSMIYGIVQQHGGRVDVESQVGDGTAFEVRLPAAQVEESEVRPEPAANGRRKGSARILLAEDSSSLRRMTRRLLERAGYDVIEAQDGNEALARFRESGDGIDLALLDVVMPERDGRATFEALRDLEPRLPVLFMTGYGAQVLSPDFLERQDVHVLAKPFEARDLVQAVRDVLEEAAPTTD